MASEFSFVYLSQEVSQSTNQASNFSHFSINGPLNIISQNFRKLQQLHLQRQRDKPFVHNLDLGSMPRLLEESEYQHRHSRSQQPNQVTSIDNGGQNRNSKKNSQPNPVTCKSLEFPTSTKAKPVSVSKGQANNLETSTKNPRPTPLTKPQPHPNNKKKPFKQPVPVRRPLQKRRLKTRDVDPDIARYNYLFDFERRTRRFVPIYEWNKVLAYDDQGQLSRKRMILKPLRYWVEQKVYDRSRLVGILTPF